MADDGGMSRCEQRPLRVALLSTLYAPYVVGGGERSTRELAQGLVRRGHQVLVITLVAPGVCDSDSSGPELIDGVEVVRITTTGVGPVFPGLSRRTWIRRRLWRVSEWNRPTVNRQVAMHLASFRPDVVHTSLPLGFGAGVWRAARRYPQVHTIRDYYLVCARGPVQRGGRNCTVQCVGCRFATTPMRRAVGRVDLVTGVSADVLERHRRWRSLPDGVRTAVVYNAPRGTRSRHLRRGPVIGYVGRIAPDKGVGVLLEAFSEISDPRVRLVIAGNGRPADLENLTAAVARDPRMSYVGVQEAAEVLDSVDIVAVPSQWVEPFGRSAYEAAVAGKRVVVSGVGGLPEAIRGYANGSVVADYSSPAAWRDALQAAVDVPATSTSWAGHPDPAERYEALYRELMAPPA